MFWGLILCLKSGFESFHDMSLLFITWLYVKRKGIWFSQQEVSLLSLNIATFRDGHKSSDKMNVEKRAGIMKWPKMLLCLATEWSGIALAYRRTELIQIYPKLMKQYITNIIFWLWCDYRFYILVFVFAGPHLKMLISKHFLLSSEKEAKIRNMQTCMMLRK